MVVTTWIHYFNAKRDFPQQCSHHLEELYPASMTLGSMSIYSLWNFDARKIFYIREWYHQFVGKSNCHIVWSIYCLLVHLLLSWQYLIYCTLHIKQQSINQFYNIIQIKYKFWIQYTRIYITSSGIRLTDRVQSCLFNWYYLNNSY